MPSAPTSLTKGETIAGSFTSQSTASFTPTANRILIAAVYSRLGTSVEPNQPTASGWTAITSVYYDNTSTTRKKITVLWKDSGSSPASQTVSFDWAGQTQTDAGWVVIQLSTGYDATPIGNTASNFFAADASNPLSVPVTFSSFGNPQNTTIHVSTHDFANGLPTPTGTTQVEHLDGSGQNDIYVGWNDGAVMSSSVSWPSSGSAAAAGIGVEVKVPFLVAWFKA